MAAKGKTTMGTFKGEKKVETSVRAERTVHQTKPEKLPTIAISGIERKKTKKRVQRKRDQWDRGKGGLVVKNVLKKGLNPMKRPRSDEKWGGARHFIPGGRQSRPTGNSKKNEKTATWDHWKKRVIWEKAKAADTESCGRRGSWSFPSSKSRGKGNGRGRTRKN